MRCSVRDSAVAPESLTSVSSTSERVQPWPGLRHGLGWPFPPPTADAPGLYHAHQVGAGDPSLVSGRLGDSRSPVSSSFIGATTTVRRLSSVRFPPCALKVCSSCDAYCHKPSASRRYNPLPILLRPIRSSTAPHKRRKTKRLAQLTRPIVRPAKTARSVPVPRPRTALSDVRGGSPAGGH